MDNMKQRASSYMALPSHDTSRGAAKKKWNSLPEVQRTFRLKYLEAFGDDGPPVVMYNHAQAFLSRVGIDTKRHGPTQEICFAVCFRLNLVNEHVVVWLLNWIALFPKDNITNLGIL